MNVTAPVIANECGSCLYYSPNWNDDYLWWDGLNYACGQLGIGITAYYWGGQDDMPAWEGLLDGEGVWQSGQSGPPPNTMGQIFLNYA